MNQLLKNEDKKTMEKLLDEINDLTEKGFKPDVKTLLVDDLKRKVKPDEKKDAEFKGQWVHPDKVLKECRGTVNLNDFKTEFGVQVCSFDIVASKLRREVCNEEILLGLEKNIYFPENVPQDLINARYLIDETTAHKIGPCICIQCSGYNVEEKKTFKVLNDLMKLRDHARIFHEGEIFKGSIINLQYPDFGKIIETRQGAISTFWLTKDNDPTVKIEVQPEVKKPVKEKKGKKEQVKLADMTTTNFPDKKTPFEWLADAINIKHGKGKSDFLDIVSENRRLGDKKDITWPEGVKYVEMDKLVEFCKGKKDHNVFTNEELLEFRSALPHNVKLTRDIRTREFSVLLDIVDKTTMIIGPCIDIDCSGTNARGEKVYRLFNSLFEFKKHCSRNEHSISEGSVLLFDKPKDYQYYKVVKGGNDYFYMKKPTANDEGKVGEIDESDTSENHLAKVKVYGHNIRGAGTVINKEMLNRFLAERKMEASPSIILLNESGDLKKKRLLRKSLENDFQIMTRGTSTAIISDKRLKLKMIFDKLNDNNNQIYVVENNTEKLILYNTYINPGACHGMRLDAFKVRMTAICERYKSAKVIVFGDFNLSREEFQKEVMNYLRAYKGIKYHIDEMPNAFTRCIMYDNKVQRSYLDYMITVNIEKSEFDIMKPIGNSDHWMLQMKIGDLGEVIPVRSLKYNFSKAKEEADEIKENFIRALKTSDKVGSVVSMVQQLRVRYKPKCKKVINGVMFSEKITKLINDNPQKGKVFWEKMSKTIRALSKEEYNNFMCDIEKLNLKRNMKEYFLKLRFYSEINKSSEIMKNLEVYDESEDVLEILTEKISIDDKVLGKYKRMFEDNGIKEVYHHDGVGADFTMNEVSCALENVAFDKATSWDYIPGEVYKLIHAEADINPKAYNENCHNIAELLNQLLKSKDSIPEEILCARLMCLNKCPGENGSLENIRPISITGMLVKLMERILLTRAEVLSLVNNITISKSQIGFVKGLGCDVNIMRLRQRVNDVLRLNTKEEKYIFFIDLKAAYDSVNHKKLFVKMRDKGYDVGLINHIKKIYSSARMRLNLFHAPLNVNKGVLQGGIISPWLFNIYIDDLIREMSQNCFEVLAYADDIAVICKNPEELDKAVKVVEHWSNDNDIAINKKKSGILVIDQDRGGKVEYKGYPMKLTYRYLGIKLDRNLNPMGGLMDINNKLDVYLSRSKWLIKTHFTPKSLVTLSMYYQHSRIGYGMSCFLDNKNIIDKVESFSIKYTKAILGLTNQVNSNRLRLILNRSLERHTLWCLMRKNLKKYRMHFKEDAWIYNKIDMEYKTWLAETMGQMKIEVLEKILDGKEHWEVKELVTRASKKFLAKELNVEVSENFSDVHKKSYFMAPDKRDGHLIRYLLDFGFYKARIVPKCKLCGTDNSRTHATNECLALEELRERYKRKLKEVTGKKCECDNLEKAILDAYYCPKGKRVDKVLEVLRSFAIEFVIRFSELEKELREAERS